VDRIDEVDKARNTFIESLSKFRPTETVFEVGKRGVKSSEAVLMHKRRKQLNGVIETTKELKQERQIKNSLAQEAAIIRTMSSINDEAGLLEFEQINSKKRKSIETGN
jgi:ATP-dependent RNA helicase DDX54/DBP10